MPNGWNLAEKEHQLLDGWCGLATVWIGHSTSCCNLGTVLNIFPFKRFNHTEFTNKCDGPSHFKQASRVVYSYHNWWQKFGGQRHEGGKTKWDGFVPQSSLYTTLMMLTSTQCLFTHKNSQKFGLIHLYGLVQVDTDRTCGLSTGQ